MKKVTHWSLLLLALSGCTENRNADSDSTRVTLREVTASTVEEGSGGVSTRAAIKGRKGKRPRIDECRADAETFCSSEVFPDPSAEPLTQEQQKSLFQCLIQAASQLGTECKRQLANLPHPPNSKGQQVQGERARNGLRTGFLRNCGGDAKNYCASSLPTRGEFRSKTRAEKVELLANVIACLSASGSILSASCQAELGVSDESETETSSGS